MMNKNLELPVKQTNAFNRVGYIAFLALSIYNIFSQDWSSAACNLGIGLVFDPFDQTVTFSKRPLWQKIWLISHVFLAFFIFGIEISR